MKTWLLFCCVPLLFTACGRDSATVDAARGAAVETGPMARVFPSGGPAREDRHGLWKGLDGEGRPRWEVRYIRGRPTGPYREWNEAGDLVATWPYNWDGEMDGMARWFEDGEPVFKFRMDPEQPPGFDPIGDADGLRAWAESQPEKPAADGADSDES
mgnify:CR=1 FL=1